MPTKIIADFLELRHSLLIQKNAAIQFIESMRLEKNIAILSPKHYGQGWLYVDASTAEEIASSKLKAIEEELKAIEVKIEAISILLTK